MIPEERADRLVKMMTDDFTLFPGGDYGEYYTVDLPDLRESLTAGFAELQHEHDAILASAEAEIARLKVRLDELACEP